MKRGLVLSGGGTFGAYHLGVWQFLREIGYEYDLVTGTSIGALNGAFFCIDDYDGCNALWRTVTAQDIYKDGKVLNEDFFMNMADYKPGKAIGGLAKGFFSEGGLDISPFREYCERNFNIDAIHSSRKKLGIVTCRFPLMKEENYIMQDVPKESIMSYLHASSAAWPIFPLEKIGKYKYADGGYRNNTPVNLAIRMGAEEIVAVVFNRFPSLPQHAELLRLPFVTPIVSFSSLDGNQADTARWKLERNIQRGYNDAAKRFGKYMGIDYTFEKEKGLERQFGPWLAKLVSENQNRYMAVLEELGLKGNPYIPITSVNYGLRSLEWTADKLGIDNVPVYQFMPWLRLMAKRIVNLYNNNKVMEKAFSTKWKGKIKEDEILPLALFIYDAYCKKTPVKGYKEIMRNNPEAIILHNVYRFLDKRNLISSVTRI